ncbi:hypothetical protein [Anaerofustis stercorihominis]|uniref:hypothetical protein n=1 Tax=Anaerofustis stercorihominis TaxID=214853 RepID=UPI0026717B1B|nr:hypothetical protein [Anaerofustis stercorihominis]
MKAEKEILKRIEELDEQLRQLKFVEVGDRDELMEKITIAKRRELFWVLGYGDTNDEQN